MTLLYLAIALGAVFGLATGRRSHPFALPTVRAPGVLALALALQLPLIYAAPVSPEEGLDPLRLTLPAGLLLTIAFLIRNRHLRGMRLALLGVSANAAVVLANGGLMPTNLGALDAAGMEARLVDESDPYGIRLLRSKDVLLRPEETRLMWLSDVLVSPPLPYRTVMSLGDLLLAAGLATLAATTLRRPVSSPATAARSESLADESTAATILFEPVLSGPAHRPSPELCRLLNAALLNPELRVELLARPAGAGLRSAAAPEGDILDSAWPPPRAAHPGHVELTSDDWALLRRLPPAHSVADLWRSIGTAGATEASSGPPATPHVIAPMPLASAEPLEVMAGRRAA